MRRVYLAVALFALVVRGRALVPTPTPDACEYQMLARSLVAGEGFTLPVRVRLDEAGPVRHDARGERAPLFPLFLAALEPLLDERGPTVSRGLQCANALVGVLDAVLVAAVAFRVARDRRCALAAGALAAWSPPLVETSCKLLAEPLGLGLILLSVSQWDIPLTNGAALGLARLARPEAAAASVLIAFQRPWRRALAALAGFAAFTGLALALGAGAPQGFLFRVANFRDVMFGAQTPAPSAGEFVAGHAGLVVRLVARNALDLAVFAVRFGYVVPFFGLAALFRDSGRARAIAAAALALALGAAGVWSTRDHVRFLVAPLALLAIPATVEARRLLGSKGLGVFLLVALVPLAFDHARWAEGSRRPREASVWDVPAPLAGRLSVLAPGQAFAAVSPWSLALATGRDGLLLPNGLEPAALRAFLDAHSEVRVVVLRPTPHDAVTEEPWRYAADLAPISSAESASGATLLWLSDRGSRGSPSSR